MKRILLIALLATRADAHDFWLEPTTFHPAGGEPVYLSLRVGQEFVGDPVPRMSQRIEAFVVRDGNGERAVNGIENGDPAGRITAGKSPAVIGYASRFSPVELPREKFEAYLREEGLDNRIAVRTNGLQRERFARYAKTILGDRADAKPFGWRFELVPVSATQFRALYEKKPLAGTLVVALSRDGKKLSARSDRNGLVSFALPKGEWLVKTVHMVPAPADSGFQWESLWASITFERR
ncbi:MAG TPA: DUF4198 domain-containing protein [Thermoanaerobaculia bacterium]|nr:DUF4198 domain-containing protein [Thermoanaerobaculia bacterium]